MHQECDNATSWRKGEWLMGEVEMMYEEGTYPYPNNFWGDIELDEDRMGNEVDVFIEKIGEVL